MKIVQTLCVFIVLLHPAPAAPRWVVGWGDNIAGQATGVVTRNWPTGPSYATGMVAVAGQPLSNAAAIAAGHSHSLTLTSDGAVIGWGSNFGGAATGTKSEYPYGTESPVRVAGNTLSNVTAISAGGGFSLAVRKNGTVAVWGEGLEEKERSQVQVPIGLSNVVAVAAGWNYGMALKKNGTVAGWGVRKVPSGLSNIVAIAAGGDYFASGLALRKDGAVFEWRPGVDFEKGQIVATNATAIAAGAGHCLALRPDGTVFGWGSNGGGEATGIPTTNGSYTSSGLVTISGYALSNIVAVAAGNGHSLALKSDGTVLAWGRMNMGLTPATVPAGLSNVVAIAAGGAFCLAITTNGNFSAFGR